MVYFAVSTSGWAFKMNGRIGDSPVLGAGLYVDGTVGAAACTGLGELVLKNLFFYDRTDVLYPESYKPREELLKALKDNPKLKIEIHGHICCTPGKDKEEIALKRCVGTIEYLVVNGIDTSRLSYKSFDAAQPIFPIPEKNEEERKANRRIEILIIDK